MRIRAWIALALSACARGRAVSPAAATLPPSDLGQAVSHAARPTDRGATGERTSVTLGARREAVWQLARAYVDALAAQDAEALGALFGDDVVDGPGRPRTPRSEAVERLVQFANRGAMAGARRAVADPSGTTVRSAWELRREGIAPEFASMQPDDWQVTPPRAEPANGRNALPTALLARWVDGRALIVGLQWADER